MTQYILGLLYLGLRGPESEKNRRKAIESFESAKRGYLAAGLLDEAADAERLRKEAEES
ncbi:MAG TPA: hypothetical protein VGK99_07985 [Acidobacteriota bacterium]|jgi:hypothetical protein